MEGNADEDEAADERECEAMVEECLSRTLKRLPHGMLLEPLTAVGDVTRFFLGALSTDLDALIGSTCHVKRRVLRGA